MCRRAVAIFEAAKSPELPSALNNWGELLYQQEKFQEAIGVFERSLAIERKTLGQLQSRLLLCAYRLTSLVSNAAGDDHPSLGVTINNLAVLYKTVSRFGKPFAFKAFGRLISDCLYCLPDDSMRLYEEALRIGEARLGPTHPEVGTVLNNMAMVQSKLSLSDDTGPNSALGRFERARSIFAMHKLPHMIAGIDTNMQKLRASLKKLKTATQAAAASAAKAKNAVIVCDQCGSKLSAANVSR